MLVGAYCRWLLLPWGGQACWLSFGGLRWVFKVSFDLLRVLLSVSYVSTFSSEHQDRDQVKAALPLPQWGRAWSLQFGEVTQPVSNDDLGSCHLLAVKASNS